MRREGKAKVASGSDGNILQQNMLRTGRTEAPQSIPLMRRIVEDEFVSREVREPDEIEKRLEGELGSSHPLSTGLAEDATISAETTVHNISQEIL